MVRYTHTPGKYQVTWKFTGPEKIQSPWKFSGPLGYFRSPGNFQEGTLFHIGRAVPCCRVGGHDPPSPALHGTSTCLTPFGSVGSSAPSTSCDSQHGTHRKLVGPDAVAVRYPGKPAGQPAIRSEDSGSISSPPP